MKTIQIDFIIPTILKKESLINNIIKISNILKPIDSCDFRIYVSCNRTSDQKNINVDSIHKKVKKLNVIEITPDKFEQTVEEHIFWLIKWYKQNVQPENRYLWFFSDDDIILEKGVISLIQLIREKNPDIIYGNYLWASRDGAARPFPGIRSNRSEWNGDGRLFFQSIGFTHSTSLLGLFVIKSSYITDDKIKSFEKTLKRSVIMAHAWWMFEISTGTKYFYFLSIPILLHKTNEHDFDDSKNWKQRQIFNGLPYQYEWTVGFLKQLKYYCETEIITYDQIKTSIISEAQRGVISTFEEVIRRLFIQMKLALMDKKERFTDDDLSVVKDVMLNISPENIDFIHNACDVLSINQSNPKVRLKAYKSCCDYLYDSDKFTNLFFHSFMGYHIYHHNVGFVAILRREWIDIAYRDLDPNDMAPYILYAATHRELDKKIISQNNTNKTVQYDNSYSDTINVLLEQRDTPINMFPRLQLWFFSKDGRLHQIGWIIRNYYKRIIAIL